MAAGVLYPTIGQANQWCEQAAMQPRGMFIGTPEIYFSKRIDNSRLIKVIDPKRRREMTTFGITLAVLFLLAMVYLWQHFSAIEYGYKIEQLKSERDTIAESNRALSLEEASLKDPARIDRLARGLGMQRPVEGQWQPMDNSSQDQAVPVMARASGIMVVSGMQ
ncbi:MAG TPA: cell division protein FtsL [Terriglobales bacterium]|jgi:cell division protein FtsL|nr:cell division protein FtsL [Terriglobales bacterium]